MTGLHPDYGLTDDLRIGAMCSAERFGVKKAAALYSVSPTSIYTWRKVPALIKKLNDEGCQDD
jgi:hypothetical protein